MRLMLPIMRRAVATSCVEDARRSTISFETNQNIFTCGKDSVPATMGPLRRTVDKPTPLNQAHTENQVQCRVHRTIPMLHWLKCRMTLRET